MAYHERATGVDHGDGSIDRPRSRQSPTLPGATFHHCSTASQHAFPFPHPNAFRLPPEEQVNMYYVAFDLPPGRLIDTPDIMDHRSMYSFGGIKPGDVFLARTFPGIPDVGIDLDSRKLLGAAMYHVVRLVTDPMDGSKTTDLILERLQYNSDVSRSLHTPRYHIYGDQLLVGGTTDPETADPHDSPGFLRFTEMLLGPNEDRFVHCTVDPSGREVRDAAFETCPVRCDAGFLRDPESLRPILPELDVSSLVDYRPLCPVCFGPTLVTQHLDMRRLHDRGEEISPPMLASMQTELIRARSSFGYDDPCDCSYCVLPGNRFPPPLNHAEAVAAYHGTRWFVVPKAFHRHPITASVVVELPRQPYSTVVAEQSRCMICQEDFGFHTMVVELPCKHVICEVGCFTWLRFRNTCPVCRYPVDGPRRQSYMDAGHVCAEPTSDEDSLVGDHPSPDCENCASHRPTAADSHEEAEDDGDGTIEQKLARSADRFSRMTIASVESDEK